MLVGTVFRRRGGRKTATMPSQNHEVSPEMVSGTLVPQKRRSPWWQISVPILCALIPFYLVVEITELDGSNDEDSEVEALCENGDAPAQVTKGGDGPLRTPEGSHSKSSLDSLVASFSRLRRWLAAARPRLERGLRTAALRALGSRRPTAPPTAFAVRSNSPATDPA